MEKMLFGTINFFNSRTGKNYGFIVADPKYGSKNYWFHRGNYLRLILAEENDKYIPVFDPQKNVFTTPSPKQGQRVVFLLGRNTKGEMAICWNYENIYQSLTRHGVDYCNSRVVRKIISPEGKQINDLEVVWEGTVRDLVKNLANTSQIQAVWPNGTVDTCNNSLYGYPYEATLTMHHLFQITYKPGEWILYPEIWRLITN